MVLSEDGSTHLAPEHCSLLVIDIQDRLMPVIEGRDQVIERSVLLIRAAQELGMPVLATTQYGDKIGALVAPVGEALAGVEPMDKLEFDGFRNPGVVAAFQKIPREVNTVILCGVETHICVYQTMLGGLQSGYRMWVCSDAVSSRTRENYHVGLARIREAGGLVGSSELIIYDLLGQAGTQAFKTLLPLLK